MATTSPKFTWNAQDFLKGLAVAALSQPVLVILTSLSAGHFNINWTEQWHLAVSSGAAYLIKNYFSGPQPPASSNTGMAGKVVALVIVLSLLGHLCKAQSML